MSTESKIQPWQTEFSTNRKAMGIIVILFWKCEPFHCGYLCLEPQQKVIVKEDIKNGIRYFNLIYSICSFKMSRNYR